MSQTPWKQDDLAPAWQFGLQPDTGQLDITGLSPSDFTLLMYDSSAPQTAIVGTGTFNNLIAASGSDPAKITYQQSTSDVATLRTHRREVVIKRGTSAQKTFDFGDQSIIL
jgi:hypothetical protein